METAQVIVVPAQPVDVVEPVINDKHAEHPTEADVIKEENNSHAEPNNSADNVKVSEPEVVPQDHTEENRPADVAASPRTGNGGYATPAAVSERAATPHTSRAFEGGAEVVTPAGTVEAPCSIDTPREVIEKEGIPPVTKEVLPTVAIASDPLPANAAVGNDLPKTEQREEHKVEPTVEHKTEQSAEHKHEVATPAVSAPAVGEAEEAPVTAILVTTEPTPTAAPAPSPGKKAKKQNESFVSEEVLMEVQKFLTLQITENKCSSNSQEINEFVEKHLNEKQRKRYVAPLVERIVQHFAQDASNRGEEVSVDVQSNICLVEQMFLAIGRRSPLQDMYTAEEEEMLDLLFHSNSSDNLPVGI
ncbi:uncharacterized protein IUM83_02734 [Phytophthora cinnamomi]|uniref:uncharacterized protein n=1 Tax=Phytophthora cinnamomi TaxID=4785 RepID=UPI00355A496F|nr:hypothetical protein IUM83_02734 [Phytophthora cinnamomi]